MVVTPRRKHPMMPITQWSLGQLYVVYVVAGWSKRFWCCGIFLKWLRVKEDELKGRMMWHILRIKLPPLIQRGLFLTWLDSVTFWRLQYVPQWTGTTVSYFWVEFLLLFQRKTPAAWELCSVHKPQGPNTLLICLLGESKFTFPRKTTAILWDHPPPHTHTLTHSHTHTHTVTDAQPPQNPTSSCTLL